jgi:hypothetical protein
VADDADPGGGRPVGDPVALRAGYEQLRERVLAGRPDGWRLGHAALAQGGIAGWIAASAATPVPAAVTRSPDLLAAPAAGCPAALPAGEIVAVLCEMALAHA